MPPSFVEKMLETREKAINDMLAVCYTYIDQAEQETCKAKDSKMREQCHLLTLGSLVYVFRALNIWKPRLTGSDIHQSIESFYQTTRKRKTSTLQEASMTDPRNLYAKKIYREIGHDACEHASKIMVDLEKVYEAVPTPIQGFQLERIEQQYKKGRPMDG
ncbi:hypothetical protein E2P81_ATG03601 [Venturia nashicola]|nr:hypothetical protein E2P81_ATG03601 [Venturia nashicola]